MAVLKLNYIKPIAVVSFFILLWLHVSAQKGHKAIDLKNGQAQLGKSERISFLQNTYDVFIVDPSLTRIEMFWKNSKGGKITSITHLKQEIERRGEELIFATNAGMYLEDNSPQGLYIEKGKTLRHIDMRQKANTNFYMQPNGVFYLMKNGAAIVQSSDYQAKPDQIQFATQSGPMLVIQRQINDKFTKGSSNKYIRSGVGITEDGEVVFAISNEQVNFYDFALLFKEHYNCTNALYLDGAISKMYLPKINRIDLDGNFGAMIAVCAPNK